MKGAIERAHSIAKFNDKFKLLKFYNTVNMRQGESNMLITSKPLELHKNFLPLELAVELLSL